MPERIGSQFLTTLQRPENRTALLQAGLQLLQPTPFGQTASGQLGRAVGAGFEARERSIAGEETRDQERQEQERKRKADSRAERATSVSESNAESNRRRADAAVTRAQQPTGLSTLLRGQASAKRKFISDALKDAAPLDGSALDPTAAQEIMQRAGQQFDQIQGLVDQRGATPAPATDPGTGLRPATQDEATAIQDAIARGANPDAVIQRLIENGINPEGLIQ